MFLRNTNEPELWHCLYLTLGMKCLECGSYNTVREKGPLVRREGSAAAAGASGEEEEEEEEEDEEEEEEEEEEQEEEQEQAKKKYTD